MKSLHNKKLEALLSKKTDTLISELIKIQSEIGKLPELSPVEKAQMEHTTDIGHLYYSSKIEGSHLTTERIEKAIHGPRTLPTS